MANFGKFFRSSWKMLVHYPKLPKNRQTRPAFARNCTSLPNWPNDFIGPKSPAGSEIRNRPPSLASCKTDGEQAVNLLAWLPGRLLSAHLPLLPLCPADSKFRKFYIFLSYFLEISSTHIRMKSSERSAPCPINRSELERARM